MDFVHMKHNLKQSNQKKNQKGQIKKYTKK